MKFKPGDIVIKTTGGNKMTIFDCLSQGIYKCIWLVESNLRESTFNEDDIVFLDDYRRFLKTEERDDKINKLFNSI